MSAIYPLNLKIQSVKMQFMCKNEHIGASGLCHDCHHIETLKQENN